MQQQVDFVHDENAMMEQRQDFSQRGSLLHTVNSCAACLHRMKVLDEFQHNGFDGRWSTAIDFQVHDPNLCTWVTELPDNNAAGTSSIIQLAVQIIVCFGRSVE